METTRKKGLTVRLLVRIAMLGVIAFVMEFLEFPLGIFPGFLKLDFSDLAALIGAFAMGPAAGMLIELVKNVLHLIVKGLSSTGGVGDLANFIVGSAYVMSASAYYMRHKTRKGAIIGLAIGIAAMIAAGALVNYFVTLPLYALVLGLPTEAIVEMSSAVIPAIKDKVTLILFAFCPFNLVKGIVLSLITIPLYKYVSPLLHDRK